METADVKQLTPQGILERLLRYTPGSIKRKYGANTV